MNAATACTVAVAYTAAAAVLIGYVAVGPERRARLRSYARDRFSRGILRARWAWRCRSNPPVPDDGKKLTIEEIQTLGNITAGRDVRSRT